VNFLRNYHKKTLLLSCFLLGCAHEDLRQSPSAAPEFLKNDRNIEKIYFEASQTSLCLSDIAKIKNFSILLKNKPQEHCWVISSTDFQGSREYNYQLSYRRSIAILNEFMKNEISPERIHLVPLGKEKPLGFCDCNPSSAELRLSLLILSPPGDFDQSDLVQLCGIYKGKGLKTGEYIE